MATIEEVFDDPDDLPLPTTASSSRRTLTGSGSRGALLEHIGSEDGGGHDDHGGDFDIDMTKVEEQSRGQGDRLSLPLPSRPSASTTSATTSADSLRPSAAPGQGPLGPNLLAGAGAGNPMAGMMSDLMKIQEAEEARMRKLEAQMGKLGGGLGGSVGGTATGRRISPEECKRWFTLYPIYFDAKRPTASSPSAAQTASESYTKPSGGRRRVARNKAVWWPQSWMIAKACQILGLDCLHEMEKTHPSDWRNPGRIKVQIKRNDKWLNPIIKNRSQLYNHIGEQLQQIVPPEQSGSKTSTNKPKKKVDNAADSSSSAAAVAGKTVSKSGSKSTSKSKSTPQTAPKKRPTRPTRVDPPAPPHPFPPMEERYPLTSPALATGVAVQSVRRDVEQERENKKKGIGGGGVGAVEGAGGKEGKMPKMKKVVVRKR